jgi:hypothetical protein
VRGIEPDFTFTNRCYDVHEEAVQLVAEGGLSEELYKYLSARACVVGHNVLLKFADNHELLLPLTKLSSGPQALVWVEDLGKKQVATDVWKWFVQANARYHYHFRNMWPYCHGHTVATVPERGLNNWTGLTAYDYLEPKREAVEQVLERPELRYFIWFLHKVLCNNQLKLTYYFLWWLRQIIFDPSRSAELVPIFVGAGGCGKSVLMEFLRKWVFGCRHSSMFHHLDGITGRFNAATQHLLVALIDENAPDSEATVDTIKYLVTAASRKVEPKFQEQSDVTSPLYIIMSCNNHRLPLAEHERRLVVIDTHPDYGAKSTDETVKAQLKEFGTLLTNPESAEWLAASLVWFLEYYLDPEPIHKFKGEELRSRQYVQMRSNGMTGVQRWWQHCLLTASNGFMEEGGKNDKFRDARPYQVHDGAWGRYMPLHDLYESRMTWQRMECVRASGQTQSLPDFLLSQGCSITMDPNCKIQMVVVPALSHAKTTFSRDCVCEWDEKQMEVVPRAVFDKNFHIRGLLGKYMLVPVLPDPEPELEAEPFLPYGPGDHYASSPLPQPSPVRSVGRISLLDDRAEVGSPDPGAESDEEEEEEEEDESELSQLSPYSAQLRRLSPHFDSGSYSSSPSPSPPPSPLSPLLGQSVARERSPPLRLKPRRKRRVVESDDEMVM